MNAIYKIINKINNRIYIGSTKNFRTRTTSHLNMLRNNKHSSKLLQQDYNKFGEESLEFEIIERCDFDDLKSREQHYIDLLNPPYNTMKIAYRPDAKAIEKLRKNAYRTFGTDNKSAKLNEDKVKNIKLLLQQDGLTLISIAKMFGVTETNIRKIKNNIIWKNIKIA